VRHAVKLGALALGLAVLFWWGWSGNFVFRQGAVFRLLPSEDWYSVSAGGRELGYAHRVVRAGGPESGFTVDEQSALSLPIPGLPGPVRLDSKSAFEADGRLAWTSFTVPGLPGAFARVDSLPPTATLRVTVGFRGRQLTRDLPLPPEGPVLPSGVSPWLSRQKEAPMGKVMLVSLLSFSPLRLAHADLAFELERAELTVEEVTEGSDEIRVFKVTVRSASWESSEWVDANGRLLRQSVRGQPGGLTLLEAEGPRALAKAALAVPPPPIPLEGFPPGVLDAIADLMQGPGGG
jgi:hypothetical protein